MLLFSFYWILTASVRKNIRMKLFTDLYHYRFEISTNILEWVINISFQWKFKRSWKTWIKVVWSCMKTQKIIDLQNKPEMCVMFVNLATHTFWVFDCKTLLIVPDCSIRRKSIWMRNYFSTILNYFTLGFCCLSNSAKKRFENKSGVSETNLWYGS